MARTSVTVSHADLFKVFLRWVGRGGVSGDLCPSEADELTGHKRNCLGSSSECWGRLPNGVR